MTRDALDGAWGSPGVPGDLCDQRRRGGVRLVRLFGGGFNDDAEPGWSSGVPRVTSLGHGSRWGSRAI